MCSIGMETGQVPAWQLSDDAVEHAIAAVDAAEAQLAARRAELLAEAEVRSLKTRTRASTTERWLGDRFHWSTARATRSVREAEALLSQPGVGSEPGWRGRVGRGIAYLALVGAALAVVALVVAIVIRSV